MNISREKITYLLSIGLVTSLPFSIAINSVILVLTGICAVAFLAQDFKVQRDKILFSPHFTWILVPVLYVLSLFYSKDLVRGFHQMVTILPLAVLTTFYILTDCQAYKQKLVYPFLVAVCLSLGIHMIVSYTGWDLFKAKGGQLSLFHEPIKNGWIVFLAFAVTCLYVQAKIARYILIFILAMALLYFYNFIFLILAFILFIYSQILKWKLAKSEIFFQSIIGLPTILILGLACLPSFQLRIFDALNDLFAFYTQRPFSTAFTSYIDQLKISLAQIGKHPLTGIGLGDYAHGIWNEYEAQNLPHNTIPSQQIMHFMVSGGVLALFVFLPLMNKFKGMNLFSKWNLLTILSCFILLPPLISQISVSVFALLIIYLPTEFNNK